MSTCKHEGCHNYEVQGTEYTTPEGRRVKVGLIKCWCCKKVIGARPELISAMPVPYHPMIPGEIQGQGFDAITWRYLSHARSGPCYAGRMRYTKIERINTAIAT